MFGRHKDEPTATFVEKRRVTMANPDVGHSCTDYPQPTPKHEDA
jgi:hypothetical protein